MKLFIITGFIFLSSCGLLKPDVQAISEHHIVELSSQKLSISLFSPMIRGPSMLAAQGRPDPEPVEFFRFPEGNYTLESEDEDYYYFKAPQDIDCRTIQGARLVGGLAGRLDGHQLAMRSVPGGLFISKSIWQMRPAGGYISISETEKIWTVLLGGDFLQSEPAQWKRNY